MGNIGGGYYPGSILYIGLGRQTQQLPGAPFPVEILRHVTAQAPRDTMLSCLFERGELGSPVEI